MKEILCLFVVNEALYCYQVSVSYNTVLLSDNLIILGCTRRTGTARRDRGQRSQGVYIKQKFRRNNSLLSTGLSMII